MKRLLILPLLMLLSQACTTISFVTDDNNDKTYYSEWHHDWFYLVEGSDAVDMNDRCKGAGWKTITTEQSFLQGFVTGLTSAIYSPHGVEYSCVRTASTTKSATKPAAPAVRRR
jgi:hypothetical protein